MSFDPDEGRRLLTEHHVAAERYRNAATYVQPPSDWALRSWLWEHRYALIQAALDLRSIKP